MVHTRGVYILLPHNNQQAIIPSWSTGSRSIAEVKQLWALVVPSWETRQELRVWLSLFAFFMPVCVGRQRLALSFTEGRARGHILLLHCPPQAIIPSWSTGSRSIAEVKQLWALVVPSWETRQELRVWLFFIFFFSPAFKALVFLTIAQATLKNTQMMNAFI